MPRALIFDLDNCLAAADEVGAEFYQPAFTAMRKANRGTLSEQQLEEAFSDCWRQPLDHVARRYGFSREMLAAGWAIFSEMAVQTPMKGYGDLEVLKDLPFQRYLVTSGFRRLQESKIKALNLAPLFERIEIDAIDEAGRKGKRGIFESILEAASMSGKEVVVVGDNPDSEIEAGNALGMKTVQILRPGVSRGNNADWYIHSLAELGPLLVK